MQRRRFALLTKADGVSISQIGIFETENAACHALREDKSGQAKADAKRDGLSGK